MTAENLVVDQDVATQPDTDEPTPDAPFGWMNDPETGERRPRKRPGRRSKSVKPPVGKSPSLEELQALGSLSDDSEDTPPGALPKGSRRKAMRAESSLPPFRAGVIAKGVNRLYRRAGQIARMMHYDIGTAIIATTKARPKDDDDEADDLTVGEAWENLARHNPRIRAFLLKFITGGDWGALFWSHLPIFMAIVMTDAIRKRLPIVEMAQAFLVDEPEDGGEPVPSGFAQMMGGINPDDMAQMMNVAQAMMGQMANGVPRPANGPREPMVTHPEVSEPQFHGVRGMEHPADREAGPWPV